MTAGEAYISLAGALASIYEPREARSIAAISLEHLTGFTRSEQLVYKHRLLTPEQENRFLKIKEELLSAKPLQYVLHEAYFSGMKLFVNEHVLIPRPETEELADWLLEDMEQNYQTGTPAVLDIGTGSGCLPVAVKKGVQQADVWAIDVSESALEVAERNAKTEDVNIRFQKADILDETHWKELPQFDYIVSNPPYITHREALEMSQNVLGFEPHLALFVPDENPLLFYDAISRFALRHLTGKGKLFFEINEAFGEEMRVLLQQNGFINIELKKDLSGKDRMIKATIPA